MQTIRETALLLSSLSVYKGILSRTVPAAFHRLLRAADGSPEEFVRAWGDFFSLLCDRGCSRAFARCFTETAFYDENAFSRAAAAGKFEELPAPVLDAAVRDLSVIRRAAALTPDDLLSGFGHRKELGGVADTLPRWENGEPAPALAGELSACVARMAGYYAKNGCGMYARYRAFLWRGGKIEPIPYPDPIRMEELKCYDAPRALVEDNTAAFVRGLPANNCLLYGDRGTGKSSTVKALLNRYCGDGLRMIEMPKEALCDFPALVEAIAALSLRFIVFIDDLSFSRQDDSYAALKAVLEGGLASRPENALIYATSNRRHLVRECFSDREGDEVHRGDTLQESLSLADERALSCDRALLEQSAERWALSRGGRSPRCARQFVQMAQSRLLRGLPLD